MLHDNVFEQIAAMDEGSKPVVAPAPATAAPVPAVATAAPGTPRKATVPDWLTGDAIAKNVHVSSAHVTLIDW